MAAVHHVGGFREDYASSLEARRVRYHTGDPPPIPRDLIWVMDDPTGNPICLGIAGAHRGRVYFCEHERGPDPDTWDRRVESAGCFTRLADSFAEFVAGLYPGDDARAEEAGNTPASRGAVPGLWGRLPARVSRVSVAPSDKTTGCVGVSDRS